VKSKSLPILIILVLFTNLLAACNLPTRDPGNSALTPTPNYLQTAQGMVAMTLTQLSEAITDQSATLVIAQTGGQPPDEHGYPMIIVSKEMNCREGTSTSFPKVGILEAGSQTEVFGMDINRQYFLIRNPDNPQDFCWIWGYYATPLGETTNLPLFTPMPTPMSTLTPDPPADFYTIYTKLDACVGWYLELKIWNTGNTVWSSGSLVARDLVTKAETPVRVSNQFEDWMGCTSTSLIQNDLAPGESGSIHTHDFIDNPRGHTILVMVTLCTLNGLAGTCLTKDVTFTP